MFWASRFCIRASPTEKVLARWAGGSKALMLSPVSEYLNTSYKLSYMLSHGMRATVMTCDIRDTIFPKLLLCVTFNNCVASFASLAPSVNGPLGNSTEAVSVPPLFISAHVEHY